MRTIRTCLQDLATSADSAILAAEAFAGLSAIDTTRLQTQGLQVYRGKVRELISSSTDLQMVHTDRLSAFDRHVALVPYKGIILAKISEYWFKAAQSMLPTCYLSAPEARVLQVEALTPIRAEIIVRGYLAGSMLRAYQRGERLFCGSTLPEGLVPFGPLPELLLTPTSKAAVYEHDQDASPAELIAQGVVTAAEWVQIAMLATKLFSLGQKLYGEKGLILVDSKYEFGRTKDGTIKLIDEVHTPDSSRLWVAASYAERRAQNLEPIMFDKEEIRRYLMAQGFSGHGADVPVVPPALLVKLALSYLDVAELLLGAPLDAPPPDSWADYLKKMGC